MDIKNTIFVNQAFASAQRKAESYRHEFIMPEHLLSAIIEQEPFIHTLQDTFYNYVELSISLENYLTEEVDTVPDNVEYELGLSVQLSSLLQHAYTVTEYSSAEELDVPHLIQGLLQLEDSWACHFLKEAVGGDLPEFLSLLITHYEEAELAEEAGGTPSPDEQEKTEPWRNYVTCLNDHLADHNPLIGREMELERTIQVLCRKEKNNPLHVGEPGVGKTALAYGLAARIEAGNVPERLAGFRIYELDLGNLLAGTQYRGDFEKRLKSIMEGIGREGNAIVYIDEIHNLIGAGRTGEGSMDASNMLKPYLETGAIRFIGSTTYDEYNRYFARSKGLVRRFQQIDILEPNIEEAIHIVEGLKEKYETYHGVTYEPDVIPYAVKASARYISDRFLPDKAIDLVDEAGAYREIHPADSGEQTVDKVLITDILARTCKVNALAMKEDDTTALESLHERISSRIYGQEEAVRQVVEAVQMSKAGLLDENKPLSGRNPYLPLHAYAHQQRKVRNHLQRSFPRHHTNLRRIADRTRRRLARNEDDGSLYAPARTRIRRQRGSMGRRAIGRWAVRSDPGTLFLWREHVLTRSQRLEAGPHPSGPILQGTWRRHDRLPVRNPSPQNNGRQAHQLRRIYDIHRTRLPLLKVKRNNEGLRTIRA